MTTRLEHSDVIMRLDVKKWVVVRQGFQSDGLPRLKKGTRLRIYEKGDNHIWFHDEECTQYAIDRKEMWYLEPEKLTE